MKGIKMKEDKILDNISLLIIGYDPYNDVWDHYFYLLNKYWKKRPKTYLISNELVPDYYGVKVISAGKSAEWSNKVMVGLKNIDTKYVLLLLEDFFTTTSVSNDVLSNLLYVMEENNIKYCKLLNQSKIEGKSFNNLDYLHVINKNEKYGISLQPSIWEKHFLENLVGPENYNAWIFEFNQVANPIQNENGIVDSIADDRNILNITHAVVQGKYLRKAVKVFKKQGYMIDDGHREVLTRIENFKYMFKRFISQYSPDFFKPLLKKIGRLIGVEFISDRELGVKK